MIDALAALDELKRMCPSWKADASLMRTSGRSDAKWRVSVRDVWGHIHLPAFVSADPEKALREARAYLEKFIETFNDQEMPWFDDEGERCGIAHLDPRVSDFGKVDLDA